MGKPFKKELQSVQEMFDWACNLDIVELKEQVQRLCKNPVLIIGSGGSLSACYFASKLFQSKGQIAKAVTPLELFYSKNIINNCSLLFLSSSGRNTDILTSFKNAILDNPIELGGITLSKNTLLNNLSLKSGVQSIFEYDNPIGRDGFLATNSLIAFFILLNRAFGYEVNNQDSFIGEEFIDKLQIFEKKIDKNFTFKVLYADWSLPVAMDIESKFSEAALGNVLLSDYRNFGHGRHNWLDKRGESTAIIALITSDDENLATKTLDLVPSNIPILKIYSENTGSMGAIDLLIKSFYLSDLLGDIQKIDPGRPGVPEYGSKLYHLNYFKLLKKDIQQFEKVSIQKKLGSISFSSLSENEKRIWVESYKSYLLKINKQKYDCIIFDYDGTLCSSSDRYKGLNNIIGEKLNNFLANNINIGIATGRGKSIRTDLQRVIEKRYWDKVIIGYYNGSDVGVLSDVNIPETKFVNNETLVIIENNLKEKYGDEINTKLKKSQLTIIFLNEPSQEFISSIVTFIYLLNTNNILCVQSDHSVDIIIRPEVSKLNVLKYIHNHIKNGAYETLCLGDKGIFPGNDFELLSHPFSLSVDEVSLEKDSCWNYVTPSYKGDDKILFYFDRIKLYDGYFKIKL